MWTCHDRRPATDRRRVVTLAQRAACIADAAQTRMRYCERDCSEERRVCYCLCEEETLSIITAYEAAAARLGIKMVAREATDAQIAAGIVAQPPAGRIPVCELWPLLWDAAPGGIE